MDVVAVTYGLVVRKQILRFNERAAVFFKDFFGCGGYGVRARGIAGVYPLRAKAARNNGYVAAFFFYLFYKITEFFVIITFFGF